MEESDQRLLDAAVAAYRRFDAAKREWLELAGRVGILVRREGTAIHYDGFMFQSGREGLEVVKVKTILKEVPRE